MGQSSHSPEAAALVRLLLAPCPVDWCCAQFARVLCSFVRDALVWSRPRLSGHGVGVDRATIWAWVQSVSRVAPLAPRPRKQGVVDRRRSQPALHYGGLTHETGKSGLSPHPGAESPSLLNRTWAQSNESTRSVYRADGGCWTCLGNRSSGRRPKDNGLLHLWRQFRLPLTSVDRPEQRFDEHQHLLR